MRIALKMAIPLIIAVVLGLATVAVIAPRVSADNGENHTTESEQEEHKRAVLAEKEAARLKAKEQAAEKIRAKEAERKETAKAKLDAAKLKVCEQREKVINRIMNQIAERGQRHYTTITRISEQAQKFYADHDKVVANYDALLADVTAKQAAALTAVETTKATVVTFKCDGTDPKGAAASFKEEQRAQAAALKAYKTSVKTLIGAIRTAHKTTEGGQ